MHVMRVTDGDVIGGQSYLVSSRFAAALAKPFAKLQKCGSKLLVYRYSQFCFF